MLSTVANVNARVPEARYRRVLPVNADATANRTRRPTVQDSGELIKYPLRLSVGERRPH